MVSYFIFRFLSLLRFVSLLSDTQNEFPSYLVPRKLGACNLKCRMEREACGKMICYSFWNLISVVPSIIRLYGGQFFFSSQPHFTVILGPNRSICFPSTPAFKLSLRARFPSLPLFRRRVHCMLGLGGFRGEMESVGEGIQMGPRLHTLCSSASMAATLTLLACATELFLVIFVPLLTTTRSKLFPPPALH